MLTVFGLRLFRVFRAKFRISGLRDFGSRFPVLRGSEVARLHVFFLCSSEIGFRQVPISAVSKINYN